MEKSALSFSNEVSGLNVLSRLIYSNFENRLVIQKKINGKLLGEELKDCFTFGKPNGFQKYLKNRQDVEMLGGGDEDLVKIHINTSPSSSMMLTDRILGNFENNRQSSDETQRIFHALSRSVMLTNRISESDKNPTFKNEESEKKYYRLIEKYRMLSTELHQEYQLIHNDIHPYNVIVDGNEKLYLVDFGRSEPLATDKAAAQKQIDFENYVAEGNIDSF